MRQVCVPSIQNVPAREESADGDDAEDVEDGGADDGADAEVALRHERPHYVGEELGRTAEVSLSTSLL